MFNFDLALTFYKRIKANKPIEIHQIGKHSRNFTSSTKNTKKAYNNYNKSKFIKKVYIIASIYFLKNMKKLSEQKESLSLQLGNARCGDSNYMFVDIWVNFVNFNKSI